MSVDIETEGLSEFSQELLDLATKDFLKRDRAYKYGKDEWQVRVKNTAPHAWLVEHGHVMLGHAAQGKPKLIVGNTGEAFVRGKNVMGKTAKAFPSEYQGLAEEFIDKMLNEKGLG